MQVGAGEIGPAQDDFVKIGLVEAGLAEVGPAGSRAPRIPD